MADSDTLVLELKISKDQATTQLQEVTEQIVALKKEQADLKKEFKEGTITEADYNKKMAETKIQISSLQSEQKNLITIQKSNNDSIKSLSASLSLHQRQYQALSVEERNNIEIGGRLLTTIQKEDAEYKKLKESIGLNQDSVGGYRKAIEEAIGTSGLFSNQISIATSAMATAKAAVNAVSISFQTLKGAIAATGIGALIIAVGALYTYFTHTAEGAKKYSIIQAEVNAYIDLAIGKFSKLGSTLDGQPQKVGWLKQAWLDFIYTMKNSSKGFLEIFTGIGEVFSGKLKQGLHDLGEGFNRFIGLTSPATTETLNKVGALAAKIQKDQLALGAARRAQLEKDAEIDNKVAKLRDIAADKTKTATEREQALAKAISLSKEKSVEGISLANKELAIVRENIQLSIKEGKGVSVDLKDQLSKARAAVTQANTEFYTSTRRLKGSMTTLMNDITNDQKAALAKRKELADKEIKEREENEKKFVQVKKDLNDQDAKASAQSEEDKAKTEIKIWHDTELKKINELKIGENQRAALVLTLADATQKKLSAINDKYRKEEKAKRDADAKAKQDADIKAENERLKVVKDTVDNFNKKWRKDQQKDDVKTKKEQLKRDYALAQSELLLKKASGKDIQDLDEAYQKALEGLKAEEIKNEKEKQKAKVNIATDAFDAMSNLVSALAGNNKTLAISAIIMEKAGAIAKMIANNFIATSKSIAEAPETLGQPWVGINTATNVMNIATLVAEAAKSISDINSQSTEKKKNGGLILGSSHSQGGVNINAEGGEFMINSAAMANPAVAQTAFALNAGYSTGSGAMNENKIAAIVAKSIAAIPVIVSEKDISQTQRRVQVRENKFRV